MRTLNLDVIYKLLDKFKYYDIFCCDLKYGNLTVDALGYSGSSTPEDARKYSWTYVGNYSNAKNSTKQQYRDWLTKYLRNSEIYG
jgi:hypothetical protein